MSATWENELPHSGSGSLLTWKRTEVQLLPRPPHRPDQRICCSKESSVGDGSHPPVTSRHGRPHSRTRALYCLTSLRYGRAGPLPVARSFKRHPRAGNRSERIIITTDLIGLRQADISHATRPGAVRASAADTFAREAQRSACCARGPLMAQRPDIRVRRPSGGRRALMARP